MATTERPRALPGSERRESERNAITRPRLPGIRLGIGLGGFVDGIVLHQILQWHHMLSGEGSFAKTTVGGLEDDTLADGLFHAGTWLAVAAGIYFLWRRTDDWRWAAGGRAFVGWLLVGWGLLNVVEGVVNHRVLGLHHVREGAGIDQRAWDLGFLAFGFAPIVGGRLFAKSAERALPPRRHRPADRSLLPDDVDRDLDGPARSPVLEPVPGVSILGPAHAWPVLSGDSVAMVGDRPFEDVDDTGPSWWSWIGP